MQNRILFFFFFLTKKKRNFILQTLSKLRHLLNWDTQYTLYQNSYSTLAPTYSYIYDGPYFFFFEKGFMVVIYWQTLLLVCCCCFFLLLCTYRTSLKKLHKEMLSSTRNRCVSCVVVFTKPLWWHGYIKNSLNTSTKNIRT